MHRSPSPVHHLLGVLDVWTLTAVIERLARGSLAPDQPTDDREAAVAAVLREREGEVEILLMRRAEREGDPWSGHMSFPGGRRDPGDENLLATAIRETREEVGIDLVTSARVVTRLPDVPAIARGKRLGMTIAAFVFALEREVEIVPNHEVAEVLWCPLAPVARGEGVSTMEYVYEGKPVTLPALNVEGRVVWGLTLQMMGTLFDELKAAPPRGPQGG